MLPDFTRCLIGGQRVHVREPQHLEQAEVDEAVVLIVEHERLYRRQLPGEPPAVDHGAAGWAIAAFYLASSLSVHRDAGADLIEELLPESGLDRQQAEIHYSVDLVMRFLPDLLKLAKSAATDDPLVSRLHDWARNWPLSSVGVPGIGKVNPAVLRTSSTLMRLYVDRVLAAADLSRLDDPMVRQAAAAVVGDNPQLSPQVAAEIRHRNEQRNDSNAGE